MKQNEFCRQMTSATPDMPEHYVQHVHLVLEGIAAQKKQPAAHRRISKRAVVALVALGVMLASITAYALTQWRTFVQLADVMGHQVPQEAGQLMQSNLHSQTINGVKITLQEAGYDGRTLLLQYSYIFPDMGEPLGSPAADGSFPLKYDALELMTSYGVDWWTDQLWINGQAIAMPGGSGSMDAASAVPGEIIHTEYWRLDNENVCLQGAVEITLPIGSSEGSSFTFAFDAPEAQQMQTAPLHTHADLGTFSATVTDAAFTPLMTYITLTYETSTEPPAPAEGSQWPFGASKECLAWVYSLQLVDQHGNPIFSIPYGVESLSSTEAQFYLPHVPDTCGALWLAPVSGARADMSRAIQVR